MHSKTAGDGGAGATNGPDLRCWYLSHAKWLTSRLTRFAFARSFDDAISRAGLVKPDNVIVEPPALSRDVRRGLVFHLKGMIMPNGTVKFFNTVKGFGFIEPEDGSKDAFVHISAVERAGLSDLREGQKVSYELEVGRNGKSAAENLSVID